jgi:prepilin-type N-terminal cleavage/methylation domain-containing protein
MRTFQKKLRRKQAGFSLIELLVVIAIIGFLATATLIALSNARKKSRDSTRKHVAAQVRKALELYYNSNQGYPNASSAVAFNDAGLIAALAPFVSLANDPSCATGALACNFQYQSNAASGSTEYAIKIPFANDGGTDCKFTTPNGTGLIAGVAQICNYQ